MQVERVDFVDVPTRDVERAIAFYRDVLELPQNPRDATEFETGNVTLALWQPEDRASSSRAAPPTGSRCASPTSRPRAPSSRRKGVEFVGTRDSGVCHMAFFEDPDGNSLILHRRYAD